MYDDDGAVDKSVYSDNNGEDYRGSLLLDGGEGDDEIWMFYDWSNSD